MGGERDELLRSITELAAGGTPVGLVGEPGMGTTTALQLVAGALPGPIVRSGGLRSLRHLPFVPLNRALGTDLASDPSRLEARLEAIVGRGVLILDDLQWADPQTLASLPAVARVATLLVGIRLGDDGEAAARAALAAAGGTLARLGPLDDRACTAMAAAARPDADGGAIAELVRRAGGNPLVLEQLLEGGDVATTLAEALTASLAAVDDPARQALAMLAAEDQGLPAAVLRDALDPLVATGLVTVVADVVRVRHRLVGTAALEALEPDARRDLHRRLADLTDDLGRRARHLADAGEPALALPCALDGAAATTGLERADLLELAAGCVDGTERASHLAGAADAALAARHPARARRLADEALAATDQPEPAVLAVAAEASARDGAAGAALDAAARVDDAAPTADQVRARAAEALALAWPTWQAADALSAVQRAIEVPGGAAEAHERVRAARGVARLVAGDGRWSSDEAALGPAARAWGGLLGGDPVVVAALGPREGAAVDADLLEALVAFHLTADSDGVSARLRRLLEQIERPVDRELATAHLAVALCDSGRTAAAADMASEGLRSGPTPVGRAALTWALCEAELAGGRLTKSRAAAEALDRTVPSPSLTLSVLAASWAAALSPSGAAPPPPPPPSPWGGVAAADLELAALASRGTGAPADVATVFRQAAKGWAGWHRRGELRCRWAAADAALAAPGGAEAALDDLRSLEAAASPLGQRPLVARIRASLRGAGVRTRPTHGKGRGPLSAREVEVLELVRLGFTSGEAAQALGVAASTIDTQVESAMRKLDARTRLHAASLVAELAG